MNLVKRLPRLQIAALGVLGLAVFVGCSETSDPYNRVNTLRVMAIRSEPAIPLPGETATYSALVLAPDPADPSLPDSTLTYEWTWCPFPGAADDGYPCLLTDDLKKTLPADVVNALPQEDLGTDPQAMLANAVDPAILGAICEGMGGNMGGLDCTGGFPVQIKLVVKTATDEVKSVFRTRWGLKAEDANTNPTVDALDFVLKDTSTSMDAGAMDAGAPTVTKTLAIDETNSQKVALVRDEANDLRLRDTLIDQSETYMGLNDQIPPLPATLKERLFVSWFVESGNTDEMSTGYIPDKTTKDIFLKNAWTPGTTKKYPRDTSRIFLVIRDNRAGVGWYQGLVNLTAASSTTP